MDGLLASKNYLRQALMNQHCWPRDSLVRFRTFSLATPFGLPPLVARVHLRKVRVKKCPKLPIL